jgi:RNA polymerase-binding transcription factor DksA
MEENAKVRYNDAELLEFKELIEKKLEIARVEFDFISNQISDLNGNNSDRDGGDLMDDSNKQVELEMLNNMELRQKQFIQNLENALLRIRNKTYGICTVTGQLIDKNRLRLVPHATKSIEGKNGPVNTSAAKKELPVRSKPKVITKVVRKPSSSNKSEGPATDDWDVEGLDDFDEIEIKDGDLDDDND